MQHHSKLITLAAALALGAGGAFAQTPAPAMPGSSTPSTVGVTPQNAAEATQKAVPRSDTGTVVRTSPSAVDKAKAAMDNSTSTSTSTGSTATMPSGTGGTSGASSTNNTNTSAATAPMNDNAKKAPMRRARADRN